MSTNHSTQRTPLEALVSNLVAGLICGLLAVVLSIGHGSLLFTSSLSQYVSVGIGLGLFSTAVLAIIGAATSSTKGLVPIVQEIPVVALATVVAATAAAMPDGISDGARLATVVVAVACATAFAGLASVLLGYFELGRLIRLAPYPVVGGFLAGTGWLILIGGIGLIMTEPFSLAIMPSLFSADAFPKFAAMSVFVVVLIAFQKMSTNLLLLPIIIFASLLAFNVGAAVTGATTDELRDGGWLVQLPQGGHFWPPISSGDFAEVDWRAVAASVIAFPAVAILTVAALLMNATGIELDTQRDINLDRELKSVGVMNLAASAGAGLPGYYSISLTLLAARLNALNRTTPLMVGLLSVAALALDDVVLDFVPTVILGGFLVWVGGSLLVEWLVQSYRRLQLREYLIIPLIFAVIVGVDFAVGILAGLVATLVLFAFEYGRLDIVRHEVSGARYQSSVETTDRRREALEASGDAILIVRLQGFLFFGTSDSFRRRIQERLEAAQGQIRFLAIDFRRVPGIDSSSVLSFTRLHQAAVRESLTVVFAGLSPAMERAFERGGLGRTMAPNFRFEADLERGLKWCEDRVLSQSSPELFSRKCRGLDELLAQIIREESALQALKPHFVRIEAPAGTRLIEQGSPSDDIIIVESGTAAVELESSASAPTVRLASVGPGSVVGEISFYLHEPRTASIIVEEQMVAWIFTRSALVDLRKTAPEAALEFHRSMASILARRLSRTNQLVRILAD